MNKNTEVIVSAFLILLFSFLYNSFDITGKVINDLPDLTGYVKFVNVDDLKPITQAKLGDKVKIKLTVENIGGAQAPSKITNKIVVKKDGIKFKTQKQPENFITSNSLKPREFFDKVVDDFQFNGDGKYCFDLTVDLSKKVVESNEDNNIFKNNWCILIGEKKEDEKEIKTTTKKIKAKKSKIKELVIDTPTQLRIEIVDPENNNFVIKKETCDISDNKGMGCSFSIDLEYKYGRKYELRAATTTNLWGLTHLRIYDPSSNKELKRKGCTKQYCELTIDETTITKTGKYNIEAQAERIFKK